MQFPVMLFALFALAAATTTTEHNDYYPERSVDLLKQLAQPPKLTERSPVSALRRRARYGCDKCAFPDPPATVELRLMQDIHYSYAVAMNSAPVCRIAARQASHVSPTAPAATVQSLHATLGKRSAVSDGWRRR
jgi:hypothetical protein